MRAFDNSWRLGLERMYPLLAGLGNPERSLRIVQVAGTNGKGSVAYLTAGLLSQFTNGAVGLYTSPHLERLTERFQLLACGKRREITEADLAQALEQVKKAAQELDPALGPVTEFEAWTAAAALLFAEAGVEYAVFEVGLGGRLDATTALPAEVAVLTSISYDHQDRLGPDLTGIAREKAAIIREGQPVVVLNQDDAALAVIEKTAAEKKARIHPVKDRFQVHRYRPEGTSFTWFSSDLSPHRFQLGLLGKQQVQNAAAALLVLEHFVGSALVGPEGEAKAGAFLASASWPGRFEVISGRNGPLVLDVGHNPQALMGFLENLDLYFPDRPKWGLFGTLVDKDYRTAAALLESYPFEGLVLTEPVSPRRLPVAELTELFTGRYRLKCEPDWRQALEIAQEAAKAEGALLCVFGSFFLVGPVRASLGAVK